MAANSDVLKKAEQISRMLWQGFKRTQIAQMMGMSYEGLLRITKTEEYREIDERVRQEVLGKMDATLARRTDVSEVRQELADEMEDAIPEAWQVLMANLRHKRDLKAALEILDRDPQHQFAKSTARPCGPPTQQIGIGVAVQIDSQALAHAIEEADKTHRLIDRAAKVPPGEA